MSSHWERRFIKIFMIKNDNKESFRVYLNKKQKHNYVKIYVLKS